MKRITDALLATEDLRAALSVALPLDPAEWREVANAVTDALAAARLYCPVCGRPVPPADALAATSGRVLINCYECFETAAADRARKGGR